MKSVHADEIHLRWMKSLRDEIRLRRVVSYGQPFRHDLKVAPPPLTQGRRTEVCFAYTHRRWHGIAKKEASSMRGEAYGLSSMYRATHHKKPRLCEEGIWSFACAPRYASQKSLPCVRGDKLKTVNKRF